MGEHYEPTVVEPMAFYGEDPQPVPTIRIAPGGKLLVNLWPDGTIEYGPDYNPDETARVFWDSLAHWFPAERRDGFQVAKLIEALRLTVEYVGLETLKPIEGWSWYDAWKEVDPEGLEAWLDHMQLDL